MAHSHIRRSRRGAGGLLLPHKPVLEPAGNRRERVRPGEVFRPHPKLPAVSLTARQIAVLAEMARDRHDEDCELVYERGVCYVGLTRIAPRTFWALVQACAISLEADRVMGGFERWTINETGRRLLGDPRT